MYAKFIENAELGVLLNPESTAWQSTEQEKHTMIGVPLGLQPTAMIRNSWADKKIGAVEEVNVAALHNGKQLAFYLNWADSNEDRVVEDNDEFVDAAAIFLATDPETPLVTMGRTGKEANMWYWRADQDEGRHVVAEGIGTTRTIDETSIKVSSKWHNGQWHVVIARAFQVKTNEPVLQIDPSQVVQFAIAIWEGSEGERAGIKSFTPKYTNLTLAPQG